MRSANDLITLESPNYQYAAARLLSYDIRKEAHGQYEYIPLLKLIMRNIRQGVYDKGIIDKYNMTSREGIFAAGDITDIPEKQIITAAGEGAKAAICAAQYIARSAK